MTIIRPHDKPRLWWLFPWSYARTLHTAANALRNLCDRLDDVNKTQADIAEEAGFVKGSPSPLPATTTCPLLQQAVALTRPLLPLSSSRCLASRQCSGRSAFIA